MHRLLLEPRAFIKSERKKKKKKRKEKKKKHEALNFDEFTADESDRI